MIFHRNPMLQEREGYWSDTKLKQVRVEPRLLDRKNFRKRWIVLQRKGTGHIVTSTHIMEAAAVVAAQTLANRLYLRTEAYQRERRNKAKKGR